MKRSSFLKALATAIVAPSVVVEATSAEAAPRHRYLGGIDPIRQNPLTESEAIILQEVSFEGQNYYVYSSTFERCAKISKQQNQEFFRTL
jgi:hypothetical protein